MPVCHFFEDLETLLCDIIFCMGRGNFWTTPECKSYFLCFFLFYFLFEYKFIRNYPNKLIKLELIFKI